MNFDCLKPFVLAEKRTVYQKKERNTSIHPSFRVKISFLITILPWYSSEKENTDLWEIFFSSRSRRFFFPHVGMFFYLSSVYLYT